MSQTSITRHAGIERTARSSGRDDNRRFERLQNLYHLNRRIIEESEGPRAGSDDAIQFRPPFIPGVTLF